MLGNCSCFYFRLLTFFKIKLFTSKPPRITIGMSNSLDLDQDRRSGGLHLGSNCLQKAIGIRQNSPLACKELNQVNTLVFNILSNIGSFQIRYSCNFVYVYHKYSDTLNTFRHAMPFKQSKSIIQKIQSESVLLNGTLSFLQTYLFLLLSF